MTERKAEEWALRLIARASATTTGQGELLQAAAFIRVQEQRYDFQKACGDTMEKRIAALASVNTNLDIRHTEDQHRIAELEAEVARLREWHKARDGEETMEDELSRKIAKLEALLREVADSPYSLIYASVDVTIDGEVWEKLKPYRSPKEGT